MWTHSWSRPLALHSTEGQHRAKKREHEAGPVSASATAQAEVAWSTATRAVAACVCTRMATAACPWLHPVGQPVCCRGATPPDPCGQGPPPPPCAKVSKSFIQSRANWCRDTSTLLKVCRGHKQQTGHATCRQGQHRDCGRTPALGRTRSTRGIRPCVLTPTSSMGSFVLYRMLTACSMLLMKD